MKLYMDTNNLNYFEALASTTRLSIIQLLAERSMNIKELADELNVSSSIMTKHIRKLESAKIITTNTVSKDGSRQKICTLLSTISEIQAPFKINRGFEPERVYEVSLPVGQFIDLEAVPPCGIADENEVLGDLDNPSRMLAPDRVNSQLLWLSEGHVEYFVPNYLLESQKLSAIEISGEFGSETAGFNDDWPSNINLSLNGLHICTFTTPGDFGTKHGILTPSWWKNNQYGILVIIRINKKGVFVNGEKKSSITIADFVAYCSRWTLRFDVPHPPKDGGGFTIFGEKFGNYAQNILFREFYE